MIRRKEPRKVRWGRIVATMMTTNTHQKKLGTNLLLLPLPRKKKKEKKMPLRREPLLPP